MAIQSNLRSSANIVPTSAAVHPGGAVVAYEQRLAGDPRWALSEGSKFFQGQGNVQDALRRIAKRLSDLGVPYAVAGGMALFRHGVRRFTEDVDILVTADGLRRIHLELDGRGYVRPFTGSKNLRDADLGVRIEFLVAGQYPGDGKQKPVAFPDPDSAAIEMEGIRYVNLPTLVQLKLASGMTNADRIKDLADVQELVKLLNLTEDFSEQLDPYVRGKFAELHRAVHAAPKRYLLLWRNKWLTSEARSLDEMIAMLREAADTLAAMRADGVVLDPAGGTSDDYAHLVTTDPAVARKYDMHDEAEFWGSEQSDEESDAR